MKNKGLGLLLKNDENKTAETKSLPKNAEEGSLNFDLGVGQAFSPESETDSHVAGSSGCAGCGDGDAIE